MVWSKSSTTAAATIRALRFLFSVHGLPEEIVSGNGPQFVAQETKDFMKFNRIRQWASNGEAKRAVRTFIEAMQIRKNEEGSTGEKLARFLLGYRTTAHTATGCTPAEILMGRRLRTKLDLLHPSLSAKMANKSKDLPQSPPRTFEIGDPVMVKDYRARRGPWVNGVIQMRLSPITYRIQVGDLFWKRHVDQLRSLPPLMLCHNHLVLSQIPLRQKKSVWQVMVMKGNPMSRVQLKPQPRDLTHYYQYNNYHQR